MLVWAIKIIPFTVLSSVGSEKLHCLWSHKPVGRIRVLRPCCLSFPLEGSGGGRERTLIDSPVTTETIPTTPAVSDPGADHLLEQHTSQSRRV